MNYVYSLSTLVMRRLIRTPTPMSSSRVRACTVSAVRVVIIMLSVRMSLQRTSYSNRYRSYCRGYSQINCKFYDKLSSSTTTKQHFARRLKQVLTNRVLAFPNTRMCVCRVHSSIDGAESSRSASGESRPVAPVCRAPFTLLPVQGKQGLLAIIGVFHQRSA